MFKSVSIWTVLTFSILITLWEFSQSLVPLILEKPKHTTDFVFFILGAGLMLAALRKIFRTHWAWLFLASIACISVATQTAGSLLTLIVFVLASLLLGERVLKIIKVNMNGIGAVEKFLAGAGMYGTLIGLMAHFPINYPITYGVMLALPLIFGKKQLVEIFNSITTKSWSDSGLFDLENLLALSICAISILHFVVSLMPEVGGDALAMHLYIPSQLAYRHVWGFDPSTYVWSVMPLLADWIFSMGFMLGGEEAARLINLTFTFLLAHQSYRIVKWAGGNEKWGLFAALIFLSTPVTYTETSSLFVESVWGSFLVAGFLAAVGLKKESSSPEVLDPSLVGLFLGFACAAKAITLPALSGILLLLFFGKFLGRSSIQFPAVRNAVGLFLLLGAIPYQTAWVITGNPLFPFFNAIFKSGYYNALTNLSDKRWDLGLSWDLPFEVVFSSFRYLESRAGAGGFQWIVLFPVAFVLLLAQKNKSALVFISAALVSFGMVFSLKGYLRYVFPFYPIFTALVCAALSGESQHRLLNRFFQFAAVVTICLNVVFISYGGYSYSQLPLDLLIDEEARKTILTARAPIRLAVEVVNQLNVEQTPVFFLTSKHAGTLIADAFYPNWYNHSFQASIRQVKTEKDFIDLLAKTNSSYIIQDSVWGTPELQKIVSLTTREIATFEKMSVRQLLDEHRFFQEHLANPTLINEAGWTSRMGATFNADGYVRVTRSAMIYQKVPVLQGKKYLNELTARCEDDTNQIRLQIDWHTDRKMIGTSEKLFPCKKTWENYQLVARAPAEARQAFVHGLAETETSIQIKKISFR